MLNRIDPRHARDALFAINPGCGRDRWHRIGRAAIAAGLTVEDIDAWSSSAPNYRGERDVRSSFNNITPNGGTGPGTLWIEAMNDGWSPPRDERKPDAPRHATRPGQTPPRAAKAVAGPSPADVWARCKPATDAHGYIVAKQGSAEGLRVVPDGYRAGWLAVPVRPLSSLDGEPVSVQYIAPPEVAATLKAEGRPPKQNHKDAPMAGVFVVGSLEVGGTAFLVEGIGQAWACWKASGCAAVVCFGWGRVRAVAGELRARDPLSRLVLVPDVGKEAEAEAVARAVGALYVSMPEGWEPNSDVNDLAQREGVDALEALLARPRAPALRYRMLASDDLKAIPSIAWRVRGVLPAQGVAALYGPSGSGKSFLTLDLGASIAEGQPWFGYRVKPAPVVYCVLEGEAGFRLRVAAWEQSNGRALQGVGLVLQPFKLTEPQDVADLAESARAAGHGAVVILDTMNRAAPDADENASADMGRIIEAAKELQRQTGGLVLLVAHTGKDTSKGLRGHSSLIAALDAAVEVSRDGDRREWRIAKAKDGEDGASHPFRLAVVDLPPDDEGDPVTSCVVRPDDSPLEVRRVKLPQGGNQRIVWDALRPLFVGNFGKGGAPSMRPCLELEAAIVTAAGRLTCAKERRTERARDAITGLVARGVLMSGEGWLWLP